MARRRTLEGRVRRERVLRLGHAHGVVPVAAFLQLLDLRTHLRVCGDVGSAIDLRGDGLHFVPQRQRLFVHERVLARVLLDAVDHDVSELRGTSTALGPVTGQDYRRAMLRHGLLEQCHLGVGVRRAVVDGDNARQAVMVAHVADVTLQVDHAPLERRQVLGAHSLEVAAAVELQRADGGDEHHGRGAEARLAAFDVDEFLGTEVRTEAGLRDDVVTKLQGRLGGEHRVAAVGDIGERATMDESRAVLERLHEVRLQGFTQQHRHGAIGVQLASAHRLLVAGVAHDDVAETLLEVLQASGQTENGHHFGCNDDVEAILTREAIARAAERNGDVAQGAIIHVHDALPRDATHVDTERVAVVDVVVQQRGQQIVGKRDGVEVAGEMEVDVLHRHYLCHTAASSATLHAEHGAEARLAEADDGLLADLVQCVTEADGRRRLAFAGGRRADGRDEDEFAVRARGQAVDVLQRNLRLVLAVLVQRVARETEPRGDIGDRVHGGSLSNLDIGTHVSLPFPRKGMDTVEEGARV